MIFLKYKNILATIGIEVDPVAAPIICDTANICRRELLKNPIGFSDSGCTV